MSTEFSAQMRLDATGLEEEVALEKARHLGHMEISENPNRFAFQPLDLTIAGKNRHALIVDAEVTTADGYAQRATAIEMLARLPKSARRGRSRGNKGYDIGGFIADAREWG